MIFRLPENSPYQDGVRLPIRLLEDDGTPALSYDGSEILATLYFANGDKFILTFDTGEDEGESFLVESAEANGFYYIRIPHEAAVDIFTKERTGPFSWVVIPGV